MLVGILGINHKLANIKLREKLAKICKRKFGSDQSLHGHHVFVLLSTCNRTEIYFHSEDLALTHTYIMGILRAEIEDEFDQKLYSFFGYDCFLHLARVTSGLDSAIVAETEIQGQVKNAYEAANQSRNLPKELHFLFQKALKIGKKVRFNSSLNRGFPTLEHAIYKASQNILSSDRELNILFIGVSDINKKILNYLSLKGCKNITICNRTNEKAKELANNAHVNYLEWEYINDWKKYDMIICGTKAPYYLIEDQNELVASFGNKLIVDLSVPRNVDPKIAMHQNIKLMNIDEMIELLNYRTENMKETLYKTEEIIIQETRKLVICFKEKERYVQNILHNTA